MLISVDDDVIVKAMRMWCPPFVILIRERGECREGLEGRDRYGYHHSSSLLLSSSFELFCYLSVCLPSFFVTFLGDRRGDYQEIWT